MIETIVGGALVALAVGFLIHWTIQDARGRRRVQRLNRQAEERGSIARYEWR